MLELKSISVKEYLELDERAEYDFAIKNAIQFNEPIDTLEIGNLIYKPFGIIKDFQYFLENGLTFNKQIELMIELTGNKELIKTKLTDYCKACNYVTKSIEKIIDTERQVLSYQSTFEEESAGIGLFDGLGIYMQIRKLANNDVTKLEAVRNIQYCDCFTELVALKQLDEFQRRLNEIYKNKK